MVGNISNFSRYDVIRALFYLDVQRSRSELSHELELGEGTIRSILDILKKNKLLQSSQKGHLLSQKGRSMVLLMRKDIEIPKTIHMDIFPKYKEKGCIVKTIKHFMPDYKVRDIAVRHGAEGALILTFDQRLSITYYLNANFSSLEKEFALKKGDALIVTFADTLRNAENACLATALTLSGLDNMLAAAIKT